MDPAMMMMALQAIQAATSEPEVSSAPQAPTRHSIEAPQERRDPFKFNLTPQPSQPQNPNLFSFKR